MKEAQTFAYHAGLAPMLWVMFALSLIELGVVHLLVALKWPWIGWPLTIISAIGAIWLVFFIRSLKHRPHRLDDEGLTVNLGSAFSRTLSKDEVACWTGQWEQGAETQKTSVNFAAIAYPNRCLHLLTPDVKGRTHIFIRLDNPVPFDAAMAAWGVPQCSDRR